jgi:hypothetical protein
MEAVDDHFFENNLAYALIFRAVAEEATTGIPLTIDLLDFGLYKEGLGLEPKGVIERE